MLWTSCEKPQPEPSAPAPKPATTDTKPAPNAVDSQVPAYSADCLLELDATAITQQAGERLSQASLIQEPSIQNYLGGDYRQLFPILKALQDKRAAQSTYAAPLPSDDLSFGQQQALIDLLQNAANEQLGTSIKLAYALPAHYSLSESVELQMRADLALPLAPPTAYAQVMQSLFAGAGEQRIQLSSSAADIQGLAYKTDTGLLVCLLNSGSEPMSLAIPALAGKTASAQSIDLATEQQLSSTRIDNPAEFELQAGQFLRLDVQHTPAPANKREKRYIYYGDAIATQLKQQRHCTIPIGMPQAATSSELRVGAIGTSAELEQVRIAFNGRILPADQLIIESHTDGISSIRVPIPVEQLQPNNQVAFALPESQSFLLTAAVLDNRMNLDTRTTDSSALAVAASPVQELAPGELPPAGQFEKERLESLWEVVAERYECKIDTQVNDRSNSRIFEVRFDVTVKDGKVDLPPDVVRVWPLFESLALEGDNLRSGSYKLVSPIGTGHYHVHGNDTWVTGHATRLDVIDGDDYSDHYLTVPSGAKVERMILSSKLGVSQRFDASIWSTLGSDKPIEPVTVQLDATALRGIGGETNLLRERFWRFAGSIHASSRNASVIQLPIDNGFVPGRGIFKLDGLLTWGFQGRKLQEDPNNPGKPDYSIFENVTYEASEVEARKQLYGEPTWCNCFDNWPYFMAHQGTKVPNDRGTPINYEDAAELSSRYIQAEKDRLGKTANWWEVKNEGTVSSEWVLHSEPGYDGWAELAKFHIAMAERIRADHPEVKVGGPASAWMALDHADFRVGQEQLDFMDDTKGKLDFYSHHFYENTDLVLNGGEAHSGGYLTGRLEGVIDLLWNHGYLTDNIKPWLITEYGTLGGGGSDPIQWVEIKNYNSYLVRYMNQQDKIHLTNAFILPLVHWEKGTDQGLYIYNEDGEIVLNNKLYYYFEFWKDYKGKLLPVRVSEPDHTAVHTHAVLSGDTIRIAVNNMNAHRIHVNLQAALGSLRAKSITQHRLYLQNAAIVRESIELDSLTQIPLSVEETSIIEIKLNGVPRIAQYRDERTLYGDSILEPTGGSAKFKVEVPQGKILRARLRVAAARVNGFEGAMTVMVNGTKLEEKIELTPEAKSGRYWGWANFDVPANLLKPETSISVRINQEGGYITSVALIPEYAEFLR
ncbi:hypothetical protein [Coraliomargarita akajimensis]|uniref:hypothetical protein n=1 Tax=Coraliomargarita akajimensis TaxID=395922 RepID=UPI0005A2BE9F|nr:hypothetical protein [Coraliomargarita akajimensis]